ncbi:rCG64185 [Rattus norvegicus]|nr:rCG64185 [Rattus norvegicus]
MFILMVS